MEKKRKEAYTQKRYGNKSMAIIAPMSVKRSLDYTKKLISWIIDNPSYP